MKRIELLLLITVNKYNDMPQMNNSKGDYET